MLSCWVKFFSSSSLLTCNLFASSVLLILCYKIANYSIEVAFLILVCLDSNTALFVKLQTGINIKSCISTEHPVCPLSLLQTSFILNIKMHCYQQFNNHLPPFRLESGWGDATFRPLKRLDLKIFHRCKQIRYFHTCPPTLLFP